jgi:hypothetical protein
MAATLSRVHLHASGNYLAIENSDEQWARLSGRELATVIATVDDLRSSGSVIEPRLDIISEVPALNTTNRTLRLDEATGGWHLIYADNGATFCQITEAELATIARIRI